MKILITGKGSYIGSCFADYVNHNSDFEVFELDTLHDDWETFNFSGYDVIFHVAGIAHQKENEKNKDLYYKVNRDLACQIASKAKKEGVRQFVFMSSMSVYGLEYADKGITIETETKPVTHYGISKLQAEGYILSLNSKDFIVSILRPPMVYGEGSPGNMTKLLKAVEKIHMFPAFLNRRSSITIDKLCEYVFMVVKEQKGGILLPQNDNYMCTSEIVKEHMKKKHKALWLTKLFNPFIKILIGRLSVINKVFGDLYYEK